MDTETTETEVATENGNGEGEPSIETLTIPKKDYETLNQTLGSLKREIKDLKKSKEESEEPPKNQKPDDALSQRLEKLALKTANITHEDDVELARKTAKKWGMEIEDVLADEDFQVKLKKQQDARANVEATSGVKGEGSGKTGGKNKAEHWINSNTPPSDEDVANHGIPKAELAKIMAHFVTNKGSNKKFYND